MKLRASVLRKQLPKKSVIANPGRLPDRPSVGGRGPGGRVVDLIKGSRGRITPDTSAMAYALRQAQRA